MGEQQPDPGIQFEYSETNRQLRVNCVNWIYGASVEDFDNTMGLVIDKLTELKRVESIVLVQNREFEYDFEQTQILLEIANVLTYLLQEIKILQIKNLETHQCNRHAAERFAFLQKLLTSDVRKDPVGAYVELVRQIHTLRGRQKRAQVQEVACIDHYLVNALIPLRKALESTSLIQRAIPHVEGYKVGTREFYREIFHPIVRPNFMLTRYAVIPPKGGEQIDRYSVENLQTDVEIYKVPDSVQKYYHVLPPEFTLTEEEYTLLSIAREYMASHKPTKAEYNDAARVREMFFNISKDMLQEIADQMGILIENQRLNLLAKILARYTAGYGILEVILADPKVQDIYINSPIGNGPIYLYHAEHEECVTNLVPTMEDALAWATRFRIESGRPLDEANPVLDTEIEVPGGRARIAAITRSLSPEGLAFAIRRHRDQPWTLPLLMYYGSLNAQAAGLLSFMIDGARTILFAGTRSAGKTSYLGASITELMKKARIVTVEDTLEIPVPQIRALGYNIERLKSRSIITHVESELATDEAIRTSLRLGDSALILGEVRSLEAKALYEAMRIGALANVVMGTIHGDSAYGVFDRVVNDLEVKPTSFKATDLIVIVNRLKSSDGLKTYRRMVELVEVRKDWDKDPQKEKGFVPLMTYNARTDQLEPTSTLLNGESLILNSIAQNVKEWRGNWEAVWENIQLRAKIKQTLVDYAKKTGNTRVLEAPFVVMSNDQFHILSERVREEYGALDSKRIYARWEEWFKTRIKKV